MLATQVTRGAFLRASAGYQQPIIVHEVGQFRPARVTLFAIYHVWLPPAQNDALVTGIILGVIALARARPFGRRLDDLDVPIREGILQARLLFVTGIFLFIAIRLRQNRAQLIRFDL